jgi:hypothetical protein
MKKLIAIGIAVAMVLGISALSHAEQTLYQNIDLALGVNPIFGFYGWIDPDPLPNVDPIDGNKGYTGYTMVVSTNYGRAWTVYAQCSGLAGQFQASPQTLDVYVDSPQITPEALLTSTDMPIYVAAPAEYSVRELGIMGGLHIPVTDLTLEDLYDGDVLFTLIVVD